MKILLLHGNNTHHTEQYSYCIRKHVFCIEKVNITYDFSYCISKSNSYMGKNSYARQSTFFALLCTPRNLLT